LGELISDTLALFEQRGGDDAFINIKYMVSGSWRQDQWALPGRAAHSSSSSTSQGSMAYQTVHLGNPQHTKHTRHKNTSRV
jgi:hypothetical protein